MMEAHWSDDSIYNHLHIWRRGNISWDLEEIINLFKYLFSFIYLEEGIKQMRTKIYV